MNFAVEWAPSAHGELLGLYMANPLLRVRISVEWPQIDPELATDAHLKGTALDNYRLLRIGPLAVLCEVFLDRMLARVLHVSISASVGQP